MSTQNKHYIFDASLQLKDSNAITASAAGQVGGSDEILDIGTGRVDAVAIVDISALDITTGDETYGVEIQGSSAADFGSDVVVYAEKVFGDSTVSHDSVDSVPGRYEIPFTNNQEGVTRRYLRTYTRIAGTTPSITHTVHVAPSPGA